LDPVSSLTGYGSDRNKLFAILCSNSSFSVPWFQSLGLDRWFDLEETFDPQNY
jgi:hypothetical protein